MVSDAIQQSPESVRELGSSGLVDWRHFMNVISGALCLLGTVALFRFLLPSHKYWSWAAAFGGFSLWRLGMHRTGMFPWNSGSGRAISILSWPQGVAEAIAFLIFVLAVVASEEIIMSSHSWGITVIVGLCYWIPEGWISQSATSS
jgi:hypothetical protein